MKALKRNSHIANLIENDFVLLKKKLIEVIPLMGEILDDKDWKNLKSRTIKRLQNLENATSLENNTFMDFVIGGYSVSDKLLHKECLVYLKAFNELVDNVINYADKINLKTQILEIIKNRHHP